ncbi:MAG TPA: YggT family protein [Gammaproteobacteria bacterium]|nr:YggT family protein [Gammaproteobacteria bacterium]
MNPFIFLIETVFYLYTLLLMLRLLLQWVRADFYNPLSQFVVKVTNPVVIPLRRIIPGLGGIDLASLLLVIALTCIKIFLITWIMGVSVNVIALLLTSLMETFILLLDIFLFSIFVLAIMSWINPDPYHPAAALLNSITRPVMKPLRQRIPPIGGMDISPMIAIIIILFIKQTLRYFF